MKWSRSERACEAARDLRAKARIEAPEDLDLELLAFHRLDTIVLWGPLEREDGHILQTDRFAVVRAAANLRATRRGRFVVAHELGHRVLHRDVDHFARCTGDEMPRSGERWRVEKEAGDFAMELLLPAAEIGEAVARRGERPRLTDIARVADRYGTSLTATAIRFAELGTAPCAVVLSREGRVVRWWPSAGFRAQTARGRMLDGRTAGAMIASSGGVVTRAETTLAGAAWGRPRLGVEVVEEAVGLGGSGLVLSWAWHGSSA